MQTLSYIFMLSDNILKKEISNAIENLLFQILKPITAGPQDTHGSWTLIKLFCSAKSSSFKQMGLVVEVEVELWGHKD